jgi:hypothetical protein
VPQRASYLVYAARGGDVALTMVRGNILYATRVSTIDLSASIRDVPPRAPQAVRRKCGAAILRLQIPLKVVFPLPKGPSKQSFLHGALILTVATAIVKLIGALFTIPLANLLTGEGMGYFYTAYAIYNVLLIISTAGLPVALSRMVSEAEARGRYREVSRIFPRGEGSPCRHRRAGRALCTFSRGPCRLHGEYNAWRAVMALSRPGRAFRRACLLPRYYRAVGLRPHRRFPQVIEALSQAFRRLGLA